MADNYRKLTRALKLHISRSGPCYGNVYAKVDKSRTVKQLCVYMRHGHVETLEE